MRHGDSSVVTPALENIIEANILLSGLGFESSGLAAAHSVHDGLTILEETHRFYHGEKVAFGTLVHLILENSPIEEFERVLNYCRAVGLPTCLKDLGIVNPTEARIMAVAEAACAENETIHNMPFPVPAKGEPTFALKDDEMEFGVGIHGEPGISREQSFRQQN